MRILPARLRRVRSSRHGNAETGFAGRDSNEIASTVTKSLRRREINEIRDSEEDEGSEGAGEMTGTRTGRSRGRHLQG